MRMDSKFDFISAADRSWKGLVAECYTACGALGKQPLWTRDLLLLLAGIEQTVSLKRPNSSAGDPRSREAVAKLR
jgi:hypothetical protein